MRPSNQFLIHQTVHPSNPSLSNLERRMLLGTWRDFDPPVPVFRSIHWRDRFVTSRVPSDRYRAPHCPTSS
ncbi:hypothetical protein QYF61_001370 [Mycteria americana]|uniref:Uncharacterized protein n=1 Tax=Mycteria americana TaxID=33587 RepID=A0AAN7MX67_MYCAM|nr:hypothetical protein QYF61_001370 [Mycteria americana]